MNIFNQIKLFSAIAVLLVVTACASSPTSESTGQYVDSAAITAKVKAELALADETSALQIEVKTFKKTVQLSGFVDSEEEKEAAGRIAKEVEGVDEVDNALIVK